MATDPNATLIGLIPFVALKKAEAKRAQDAVLTLVPGSPTTRAALASFAVTNQARDSLRREKKAAAAVISAIEAVVAGQPAATAFAGQPALRDLAPDALAAQFTAVVDRDDEIRSSAAGRSETTTKELWAALGLATAMLIEAIGRTKNQLFTTDEAEKYDDYLDLLSGEDRDQIVKPAEED